MRRARPVDYCIAAAAFAVLTVNLVAIGGAGAAWPGGWALSAVACVALVFRRTAPLAVTIVTAGCAILYYPAGYPDSILAFVFLFSMSTLAATAGRLSALLVSLVIVAGFTVAGRINNATFAQDGSQIAGVTGMLLLAVIIGEVQRSRTQALRRAEAAERTSEEQARMRATEERLRIARELHDVLAHQISLINVQAGAALHRREPEQAFAALENIKAASKETLRELRGVLGVLRQYDDEAPVAPVPSLRNLPELVAQTSAGGIEVRLEEIGDGAVPAPADLAAYRIVQEALTNVVRHSGAAEAEVRVVRGRRSLIVTVADDGTGHPAAEALAKGNGLRGMRERAASAGGTVVVTPGPAGFVVRAEFPVEEGVS